MEENRQTFDKIQLLNFMTEDILSFAAQKLGPQFMDHVDMNCGAIPQGEYEKIIDPDSPRQFLSLYKNTVLKRLNLTATSLLQLDQSYQNVMADYFFRQGKNLQLPKPKSTAEALSLFDSCILCSGDGRSFQNQTPESISWTCSQSTPTISWPLYWNLMCSFASGFLSGSGCTIRFSENRMFTIEKK